MNKYIISLKTNAVTVLSILKNYNAMKKPPIASMTTLILTGKIVNKKSKAVTTEESHISYG